MIMVIPYTLGVKEWKVTKGVMVIVRDNKRNTLYMTTNPNNVVAIAEDNIDTGQWHNRLGHMSQKRIR